MKTKRPHATRTAAASLVVLASVALAPHIQADTDPWFGRDKAYHFGASAALSGAGYAGATLVSDSRAARVAGGFALGFGAGIAKETYDLAGYGDPSLRDLAWDAVGTATGLAVAWLVDRYWLGKKSPPANPAAAAESWRTSRDLAGRTRH